MTVRASWVAFVLGTISVAVSAAESANTTMSAQNELIARVYQTRWGDARLQTSYLLLKTLIVDKQESRRLVVLDGQNLVNEINLSDKYIGPASEQEFSLVERDKIGQEFLVFYDRHGEKLRSLPFNRKEIAPLLIVGDKLVSRAATQVMEIQGPYILSIVDANGKGITVKADRRLRSITPAGNESIFVESFDEAKGEVFRELVGTDGKVRWTNSVPADVIASVSSSPDGELLIFQKKVGNSSSVTLVDVRTGHETVLKDTRFDRIDFCTDGGFLLTHGQEIAHLDSKGAEIWRIKHNLAVDAITIFRGGRGSLIACVGFSDGNYVMQLLSEKDGAMIGWVLLEPNVPRENRDLAIKSFVQIDSKSLELTTNQSKFTISLKEEP